MLSKGEETPSIRERLQRGGITEVVVIDNSFDDPTLLDLAEGDIDAFWSVVQGNVSLRRQMEAMDIDTGEVEDIDARDEAAFAKLWAIKDDESEIAQTANNILFKAVLEDRERTGTIVNSLAALALRVTALGAELRDSPLPAKLVFLDYYLGPVRDDLSKSRAAAVARRIYDQYSAPQEKPFIVLMSSVHDAKYEADQFRSESGLLGGLFEFVAKEDLIDQTMLGVKLASWAAAMPDRHEIQSLVEMLESSLIEKSRDFMAEVKSLTFDDYAFIQSLSLEEEGHLLGDYMLSLFGSLLVNSILEDNDALASNRAILNRMSFTSFVPSQRAPSNHLAKIYSLSITEPMHDDSVIHPLECSTGNDGWLPRLRLGDVWIKDSKSEVYMVANPDCDLAFGPGGRRKIDKDLSVLLIPGRLVSLDHNPTGDEIRTDLFQIDDENFRIYWEPKKTVAVAISKFRELYSDGEYSRRERLRLPYALRIQHAFTSHVSQVGVPVAPPLYERVGVRFYAEGEPSGWEQLEEPVENGAAIIYTSRNEGSVVITKECIERLLKMMPTVIDRYIQKRETANDETRKQRLGKKIAELESNLNDPRHLLAILEKTWEIPGLGDTTDLKSTVVRLHNRRESGQHCSDHYICLDILHPHK